MRDTQRIGRPFLLAGAQHDGDTGMGKLNETRAELEAKQDKVHQIFAAAGEDLDFANPEVLKLTGASDSKGATEHLQQLNAELTDLTTEVERLTALEKQRDGVDEAIASRARPVNQPPLPGPEPDQPAKTLGELIVESPIFQAHQKGRAPVGVSIVDGYGLRELKTTFSTSAGWAPQSIRVPGLVIPEAVRPIQVLDIIPPGTTGQAAVVYMEQTTATYAAAERAEAAAYAEATLAMTQQSSTVRSIGASIPVTDEQLADVPGVQSFLNQQLGFGVRQRLDGQILTGAGTGVTLTGILNTGSIQTQAKGSDPVPDAIHKAMTLVRVTGRAFPNAVVFHPNDWQAVRLLRTADGIYIWGSPSEVGPERIWGLRVVQSDAETENTALVGDFATFCQLYERTGLEVAIGYVNDDFLNGMRTIRAGLRAAFVVYRPAAFCTVTGI